MRFRECTLNDLDYIAEHSTNQKGLEHYENVDLAQTLEHEGEPLVVGGFKIMTPTAAFTWMTWTDKALEFRTVSYRTVKEWLDITAKRLGLKILLAIVDINSETNVSTAEHLGYEQSVPLPGFLDGLEGTLYIKTLRGD